MNSAQNLPIYWNVGTGFQTTLRTMVGFRKYNFKCKYTILVLYKMWILSKVKRWTRCSTKADETNNWEGAAFTLSSKVIVKKSYHDFIQEILPTNILNESEWFEPRWSQWVVNVIVRVVVVLRKTVVLTWRFDLLSGSHLSR